MGNGDPFQRRIKRRGCQQKKKESWRILVWKTNMTNEVTWSDGTRKRGLTGDTGIGSEDHDDKKNLKDLDVTNEGEVRKQTFGL